jgi:RNA polymerase sigma factor (sigma-70 family)
MLFKVTKSDPEKALVEGCKKADRTAQRQLYEKYSSRMYGICLRYVRADIEAEDVLMKGFMKVFANIDRYAGTGSLEGWIKKIIVNEALEYLRRNKKLFLHTEIEAADFEPDFNLLDNKLETEELMKMIQQLPPGYQAVFNLYAIEGYAHKEIAEMLGISENTSKSQLSRARQQLQQYLYKSEKVLQKKIISNEDIKSHG